MKRISAYSAGFIAVIAIALLMNLGMTVGLIIIGGGIILLLLFRFTIDKPHLEPWLEMRRLGSMRLSPAEQEKVFSDTVGKAESTVVVAKEMRTEEAVIESKEKAVSDHLARHAVKKDTIGDMIQEMSALHREGFDRSYEEFAAEIAKEKSLTDKLVNTWEDEHSDILHHLDFLHKNADVISKNLEGLRSAREEYSRMLETGKLAGKEKELGRLEESVKNILQHERSDIDKLRKEAEYITAIINQLSKKIQELRAMASAIGKAVKGTEKERQYENILRRMQRLHSVNDKMTLIFHDHRVMLNNLISELIHAKEALYDARNLQLSEERVKRQLEAEKVKRIATASNEEIFRLSEKIAELKKSLTEVKATNELKLRDMSALSEAIKRMQARLAEVRSKARADPMLKHELSSVLREFIEEKTDMDSSLRMLLVSLNKELDIHNQTLKDTASRVDLLQTMHEQLIEENTKLHEAQDLARKEIKTAKAEIEKKNQELMKLKQQLKEVAAAAEDKERIDAGRVIDIRKSAEAEKKQIQEKIERLTGEIQKLHYQIDDAIIALEDIPKDIAPLDASIKDAEQLIQELLPKVKDLKMKKESSAAKVSEMAAQLDKAAKESEARIAELRKRNNELEQEYGKLKQRVTGLNKEIVEQQLAIEHLEEELEKAHEERPEETVRTIEELKARIDDSEKREQAYKNRIDSLTQELKELEQKKEEELSSLSKLVVDYEEKFMNLQAEAEYLKASSTSQKRLAEEIKRQFREKETELKEAQEELKRREESDKALRTKEESERVRALQQRIMSLEKDMKEKSARLQAVAEAANDLSMKEGEARKEIEMMQSELEKAQQSFNVKLAEMERAINNLKNEKAVLIETIDEQKGKITELKRDIGSMQNELDSRMQKEADLQHRISEMEIQLKSVESSSTGKEASLKLQIARMRQELAEMTDKNRTILQEKEEKVAEIANAFNELQQKHMKLNQVHDKLGASAGTMLRSAKEKIKRLSAEKATLAEENKRLSRRVSEALARYQAANQMDEEAVEILKEDYEKAQKLLQLSSQKLANVAAEKKVAEERIHELEQELDNERLTLQALQKEFERINNEKKSAEEDTWFDDLIRLLTGKLEEARKKLESVPEESLKIATQGAATSRTLREYVLKRNKPTFIINEIIKEFDDLAAMISGYKKRKEKEAELTPKPKVIAIGDAHGDLDRLRDVMIRAGVIDHDNKWAERGRKVVLLGDYIDRGPETFELLNFIMKLKSEAGDDLVLLIGNHEAMFLGAFDWVGYDNTAEGKKTFEEYEKNRNLFLAELARVKAEKRRDLSEKEKIEIGKKGFRVKSTKVKGKLFRKIKEIEETIYFDYGLLQRLDTLKEQWLRNETKNFTLESNVCKELGWQNIKTINSAFEKFRDPREFLRLSFKGKPLRDYISFLRKNLETYYEDAERNILFVHAGIPYHVTNAELTDQKVERKFKGYFTKPEIIKKLRDIKDALRNRNIQFWMAFGEETPLFACNPSDRTNEWDKLSQFSDELVKDMGYNAVVFGHSQHDPRTDNKGTPSEESNRKLYENSPRRTYNIDFGMSVAYDHQCPNSKGGWLEVFDKGIIKVKVLYKASKDAVEYPFRYKE